MCFGVGPGVMAPRPEVTNDMGNTEKLTILLNEARAMGIQVLPPDVNEGQVTFAPAVGQASCLPGVEWASSLPRVRGVGFQPAEIRCVAAG